MSFVMRLTIAPLHKIFVKPYLVMAACTRVIAMESRQSPVGSRVQQTQNCAEQHSRYGVSPCVYRPAGR